MNSDDDEDDLVLQCLYDEFTLLEVVMEGDFESVQSILDDNPTVDELNERDRTGKVHMYFTIIGNYYNRCIQRCILQFGFKFKFVFF